MEEVKDDKLEQRKSNLEVLDEGIESRIYQISRVKFIGHLLRHNVFVTNIIEDKVHWLERMRKAKES